ncbi:4-phosphoerythronate dehydrogenase [Rubrivirga marina]|uniref:Erythronate-4-phosphate dehydrogenase n=1 Tax=Rubrivirga marina TaxID=1196024 RepID=A0A271J4A8_9BACT|nr:4-phosphoerythronate dehydrogenase [Rubrivirga marina]PAP78361.1 hypothetical protein BSZ37_19005 [Rubrivirga marina]
MTRPPRLLVDANIPHAQAAFGGYGLVRTMAGRDITRDDLAEVEALLVRSVTPVDAALIDGTPVRFVGTATAGIDHVDVAALDERGIAFASAPGSNAASVVDYVVAALLAVAADRGETLDGKTLGVVGVGEVGGRLVPRARALGLRVLVSDPPRASSGQTDHDPLDLDAVLAEADVVTLHTPLTRPGESPWPTLGLIDAEAASRMKPDAWLINAARGRVVTSEAAATLATSRPVVLDVWPNEPEPDPALVRAATLATPHVAGYAADAKTRGTAMLAAALAAWAGGDAWTPPAVDPIVVDAPDLPTETAVEQTRWLDALARQAYDVRADDARFRAAMAGGDGEARAAAFATLRKTYPERRELDRFVVRGPVPDSLRAAVTAGLGMDVDGLASDRRP